MQVVILVGGQGTRIKSVLPGIPKPMALILGRPFLEYVLDFISSKKISRVHMAIGYLGHIIERHFGPMYKDLVLSYSKEETPLGTGGAVLKVARLIGDEYFMVMNGDSFADFDIADLIANFDFKNQNIIVVTWLPDVSRYGKVNFDKHITSFSEKGEVGGGYINTGIYVLNQNIFSGCDDGPFSLEEHLAKSIHQYKFAPYVIDSKFIDIGTLEDLARTDQFFSDD
jgi:D-glycero-alpha-D-manno-heptose 1-phosphate guanylyltransferase